jgi:hypothetical protein
MSLATWGQLLFLVLVFSFVIGLIGTMVATMFHLLNRVLVELWKLQSLPSNQ